MNEQMHPEKSGQTNFEKKEKHLQQNFSRTLKQCDARREKTPRWVFSLRTFRDLNAKPDSVE